MMIADCHMHTWFSSDSEARPEDMIEQALRLGMKELCITDHYDMDYPVNPETGETEFRLDTPAYREKNSRSSGTVSRPYLHPFRRRTGSSGSFEGTPERVRLRVAVRFCDRLHAFAGWKRSLLCGFVSGHDRRRNVSGLLSRDGRKPPQFS